MTTSTQTIQKGYKQTDIGIIPTDWEVRSIESLTPQGKKYGIVDGPFGSNLKTEHYRKSGIPIITSGYVTDGKFYADEYLYVDKEKFKQEKRSAVRGGDIVMAKIGARSGASAILPKSHEEGILSGNALKITIDEDKFSTFFVWQILWNLYTNGDLELLRTTGAQPALSMANLKKYNIAIPSKKTEQEAIATALIDTDVFIKKLESLIEKKKNIKQGVMQELLTSKRRLHGFSLEWQKVKLGELFSLSATYSKIKFLDESGNFLIMDMGSISSEGKMIALKRTSSSVDLLKTGDLVMPKDDIGGGNIIGKVAYIDQDNRYVLSDHVYKLTAKTPEISTLFFSYLINSNAVSIRLKKKVAGSAQLGLGRKSVEDEDVDFPKDKDEQVSIASVLSDMDTEIEKLESQLTKYQNLKQGMMQTLLTGKIRLLSK